MTMGSKVIKQLMIEKDVSIKQLAEMLGIKPQSVSNKLYRDNYTLEEFINITNLLGADVVIVSRSNGSTFKVIKEE